VSIQYGQLAGSLALDVTSMRREFERVALERILNGAFAKEYMALESNGGGVQAKLKDLYAKAADSELAKGDRTVRQRLGLKID